MQQKDDEQNFPVRQRRLRGAAQQRSPPTQRETQCAHASASGSQCLAQHGRPVSFCLRLTQLAAQLSARLPQRSRRGALPLSPLPRQGHHAHPLTPRPATAQLRVLAAHPLHGKSELPRPQSVLPPPRKALAHAPPCAALRAALRLPEPRGAQPRQLPLSRREKIRTEALRGHPENLIEGCASLEGHRSYVLEQEEDPRGPEDLPCAGEGECTKLEEAATRPSEAPTKPCRGEILAWKTRREEKEAILREVPMEEALKMSLFEEGGDVLEENGGGVPSR